jgi:hypothetical protein
MNWEILVVPVIVLVVWILTHVIRPPDELPAKDARQEPEDGEPAPRLASEVDRFLEEINRMRRKAAEEQGLPPPAPRPSPPREEVHTAQKTEVIPVLEPARPARPRPRRAAPAPVRPAQPALVLPAKAPPPVPVPPVPLPPSPAENLRALLSTPNAIRNAMILKEIFGPPRSRRR